MITYFGPSFVAGVGDFQWLGIAWGIALILMFIADENFVPSKRNLSSDFRHAGHISHNLIGVSSILRSGFVQQPRRTLAHSGGTEKACPTGQTGIMDSAANLGGAAMLAG